MKTDSNRTQRNTLKLTRNQLVMGFKIAATSIIWLVFVIGIWEDNGNTTETLTVVLATLGMVIGTLYIWHVDQIGAWLKRNLQD